MLYFTANPRDGYSHGATSCNSNCCCETIRMMPSETNLVVINYAGWAVPIGELIGDPTVTIAANTDGCSTASINGVTPPVHAMQIVTTPVATPISIDLAVGSLPVGNFATFEIIPVHGVEHGQLLFDTGSTYIYTPVAGFIGYDKFWIKTTDADGRTVVSNVVIEVGNPPGVIPRQLITMIPYVDLTKIKYGADYTARFPLYMSLACRSCETYRMTWEQSARDCDGNIYDHIMCFEIRCATC